MDVSVAAGALWHQLRSFLTIAIGLQPIRTMGNLAEAADAVSRLRDKVSYRGMYEILDYDATLKIVDRRGKKAILTRRELIRFRQDNIVAIHDHAWGDGDLFADYKCQPGVPVDFYEDGSKRNVLISLRETKNRGDMIEFWIERGIKDGLLEEHEWFETEIDHLMTKLKLSIIFPKGRPCRRATLSRRSTGKMIPLSLKHFALLPDGRQKLTWTTRRPKLHDRYTIKWDW